MAGLKNILIVEDEPLIADMYKATLTIANYVVEVVGSATELYKKLVDYKPDCILLDIMLPETSGLEILAKLRTDPSFNMQHTKIIMMTNLAEESVKQKAIETGADGYFVKSDLVPQDLTKILSSLDEDDEAEAA